MPTKQEVASFTLRTASIQTLVATSPNLFRDVDFRRELLVAWSPPSPSSSSSSAAAEASATMVAAMDNYGGRGRLRKRERCKALWVSPPYERVQDQWNEMNQARRRKLTAVATIAAATGHQRRLPATHIIAMIEGEWGASILQISPPQNNNNDCNRTCVPYSATRLSERTSRSWPRCFRRRRVSNRFKRLSSS